MEHEIIDQIVQSLETWNENPESVGEEVRAMRESIYEKSLDDDDELLYSIYHIIELYSDDYELGRAIRRIYIPLKVMLNDKGSPEGNNNA
jgi:hypothetical protein